MKGSGEPYEAKGMPSLCEEFVASNALSIVQSVYEDGWIIKAIEHEDKLIGFTMFGWNEQEEFYELCRIMIDRKVQNNTEHKQSVWFWTKCKSVSNAKRSICPRTPKTPEAGMFMRRSASDRNTQCLTTRNYSKLSLIDPPPAY